MNPLKFVSLAALLVLLASCAAGENEMVTPQSESRASLKEQTPLTPEQVERAFFVPGTAVVKFSEAMTERIERAGLMGESALAEVASEIGVASFERLFPYAVEYEERTRREGMHRFYLLEFD